MQTPRQTIKAARRLEYLNRFYWHLDEQFRQPNGQFKQSDCLIDIPTDNVDPVDSHTGCLGNRTKCLDNQIYYLDSWTNF